MSGSEERRASFVWLLRRDSVRLTILWVAVGSILAELGANVRDFIDFDGGRYQQLAISIARTHSLVPRVNGVDIHSFSQLYPLIIAPIFAHGLMATDFRNANIAGAYIMCSACIPAFLLTRRLTQARWALYFVAAFSMVMPWMVTSFSLMTEIAAYPACTWALYAVVVAFAAPSWKHDLFALLTLALAFFARGELIGLAIALPLALVAFELGRTAAGTIGSRARAAGGSLVKSHLVLVIAYVTTATVALVLYLESRLASVLGIYSAYESSAHLAYRQLPRSLVEHLATFSLGVGVVPCVIALAWMGANVIRPSASRDAHAFACFGAAMSLVLFTQATNFDLTVNAYVHDRFLMYFVPVMLIGAVLAVQDTRKLRWSLALPLTLVVAGFVFGDIPDVTWKRFVWLDLDTPISTVYRVLALHLGGLPVARALLAGLAVAGTWLFVAGTNTGRPRRVTLGLLGFCAVAMVAVTSAVFIRTFTQLDRNGRSVTASLQGTYGWIDGSVGPNGDVTVIPYPISSDWFVNQQRWVDFEFFNKSIRHIARVVNLDPFDYMGFWFPKLDLNLDPQTGAVAESPSRWVVESEKETRFRLAGVGTLAAQGGVLIDAGSDWRLAWRTFGLYDDGWTRPGVSMRMRVYPAPGQQTPVYRNVAFVLRGPQDVPRRLVIVSADGKTIHAVVTPDDVTEYVEACVPATGYAEVHLTVDGSSAIPGDLATYAETQTPRNGGVFIAALSEADEIGQACVPKPATAP